jgi:predicted chitinase
MVTLADLHAISGVRSNSATTKAILDAFNRHAAAYGVTTPKRIALCLAHICVETGGFRRLDENLNYSAARLRQVWPKRFPSDDVARKYAGKPRELANFVYGDRLGNRGRPDAGWLYRGSGPGQVTAYNNFLRAEKETGIPFTSQPDLMRDPDMGMKATLILWKKWGMNELADADQVTASRRKWNGGTHGLGEVKAAWSRGMKRDLSVPGKGSDTAAAPSPKPTSTQKPTPAPQQPATPEPASPSIGGDKTGIAALLAVIATSVALFWQWVAALFCSIPFISNLCGG